MVVYLDEIMGYTKEGVNHKQTVEETLKIFSKHNLGLKPEKCEFSKSEVEYPGVIIPEDRIRMDPIKVKAVVNSPAPRSTTSS